MHRVVDGILFEGEFVPDCWDVSTWSVNGVLERSARQVVEWREVGPFSGWDQAHPVKDAAYLEEKRLSNLKRAARRAKTECRRLIITAQFDQLLTLTYRENQTDRELCKRHFKAWVRLMRVAVPGFKYVASFERQERGAMHVHLACHKFAKHVDYKGVKIPSWELGTRVWRRVVGADNGLCHVGAKKRHGGRSRKLSLAKMASYVSKYILKDYEDAPEGSNRFSRSDGIKVGPVDVVRLRCDFLSLLQVSFELYPGQVVVSHRLNRFQDGFWLCTEKDPDRDSYVIQ